MLPAAIAGLLWFYAVPINVVGQESGLHIVAVLALFLLAERTTIDLEVQRQTWFIQPTEIPFVVGLFLLHPLTLLAVRLASGLSLFFDQRRMRGKQIFNIGTSAVEVGIAELIFRSNSVHTPAVDDPRSLAIAVLAIAVAETVGATMVALAVAATSGKLSRQRLLSLVLPAVACGVFTTVLGLITLLVLATSAAGIVLLLVIGVLVVAGYRTYGRFLTQHENLGRVYEFSRAVERARTDPSMLDAALRQARDMFNATRAVLCWDSRQTQESILVAVAADGSISRDVLVGDAARDPVRLAALNSRRSRRFADRELTGSGMLSVLPERKLHEVIIAPLRTSGRTLGTLELWDRQGQLGSYGNDDLRLLETLATHLTVAIENQQLVERLRETAYHDRLTGLPNRQRLAQHIEEAIDELADGQVVALCQFDIDRFKEVNDSLGHAWGDQMLRQLGRRLEDEAPAGSVVARVGADEFAVLLTVSADDDVEAIARRLRTAVGAPYSLADLTIDIVASVGVALAPEHASDADALMRRVDVALSSAKSTGRAVTHYHPGLDQASLHRLRLITGLREALGAGEIVVRYQPKVSLRSRELIGVEALVRWNHPEFGEVVPDDFIQLAEVTGLVGPLTAHVLKTSLAQCRQWLDRDLRIGVAVNLSARNLLDSEFPEQVAELLRAYDVPPDLLTFELTESSVMTDPDRMKPILHRLHALGTELSIDDFGTGYSSLAQLRRLPVDEVKIDKVFVFSMGTDLGDLAIVRAIIELGHSLGLKVVAEGVEDELARDLLAGNDCDVIQGYLVSRALDPDRLDAWMSARTTPRPAQPGVTGRRLQLLGG